MARERRRRSDYDDDFDDLPIEKPGGNTGLVVLAVLAIIVLLLACLIGGTVAGVLVWQANSTPAKLVGSWKGRARLGALDVDVIYTFNKDGTFHQDAIAINGRALPAAHGRWQWRDDQVDISWDRIGGFERATVTWVDSDTMNYRIVGHSDVGQIGMTTRFQRR
jgi:hypothetical protein